MSETTVECGTNKVGKQFALIIEADGTFGVWARCANYSAHVHGGVSYAWRYCQRKMTEAEARALFARKLKGSAK